MKNLLRISLAFAILAIGSASASAGFNLLDDFNRGNSVSLGSNWTASGPLTGAIGISDGKAYPYASVPGSYLYNSATSHSIEMDVFGSGGAGIAQAGAVLGFADQSHQITAFFQGGSSFDSYGIYYGGSGRLINLGTNFGAGRIIMTLSGTTITLAIDAGFTGTFSQVYTQDFSASQVAGLGTGIGILLGGGTAIDNFGTVTSAAVPEPSSLALCGIAGIVGLGIARTRRQGAGRVTAA